MVKSSGKWGVWLAVFFLLGGAGLRLWFIGAHGLDADELFTLNFLRGPTGLILSTFANVVIEVDAKLYYLLHQPWVAAAGITELALRLPNVFADLLLGALLVHVARRGFTDRAAVIVGALWAANPLLIWAAGMVRMYSLLGLLAALAWVAAIRAGEGNSRRWWTIFVLSALAASYVHVLGLVVIATSGVIVVALAILRRRWQGLAALAVVGIAYLPYFLNLWAELSVARRLGADLPLNPLDFLARFLAALAANQPQLPLLAIAFLLTVMAAGWWKSSAPRLWIASVTALFLIFALASGYLALRQSIFESRYVAYGVSLFVLLLAVGVSQLPFQWLRVGLVLAYVGLGLWGMDAQSQPGARDDFRSAARFLESHSDTGDLIITMGDFALPPLQYAYRGQAETIAPWHDVVNGGFRRKLAETLTGRDTVWIVLYQINVVDPDNRFDSYFRGQYPIRTEVFPTGLTVRGYDLRPMTAALPPEAEPMSVVWEGRLALRGVQTYAASLSPRDDRLHPPSGWIHVTLYWEALQPGTDFALSLQMEDAIGQVWGINLTRPDDVFTIHPPASWQAGQIWRSDTDINLNPATPPGIYNIVLRVAAPGSDEAWADDTGNSAILVSTIEIVP